MTYFLLSHLAVCHLLLLCIWEEIKYFLGKEPSWNPICCWLGNTGAIFNGRCLKEVPCWWSPQLMYHGTTVIRRCQETTQLCDPNGFWLNSITDPVLSLDGVAQRIGKGLCNYPFFSLTPTPSACKANSKWARREWEWVELSVFYWFIPFIPTA